MAIVRLSVLKILNAMVVARLREMMKVSGLAGATDLRYLDSLNVTCFQLKLS
jgi:hypothetical protein